MAPTVYGSLATVNELVINASEEMGDSPVPDWWFSVAADAVARGDLESADDVLAKIEGVVDDQNVIVPVRDARQLLIALMEDRSA